MNPSLIKFSIFRLEDWKEKRKQEQETAMMKKNPDQYRNK